MKLMVYLAAPYTLPDPVQNLNRVCLMADKVISAGHIPFVPHLTMIWQAISPKPEQFWYSFDLNFLERCDCLLRISGVSKGADEEADFARARKIPVLYSIADIHHLDAMLERGECAMTWNGVRYPNDI